MRPDELERRLQERLDALGPAPRAELLHVLLLPDFEASLTDEPERPSSCVDSRSYGREMRQTQNSSASPDARRCKLSTMVL